MILVWAIARQRGGRREYYADELPGTDTVRWVADPGEAWAVMEQGQAEMVRSELARQGFTDTYLTTVDLMA